MSFTAAFSMLLIKMSVAGSSIFSSLSGTFRAISKVLAPEIPSSL